MSNEERASPLDLLRAGVTQGRQRVEVHNLKNEQSQLDKRRRQAVVELGELAWQERLTHPDYSSTFAGLVKLERQRTGLQSQLDDVLTTISQQERRRLLLAANNILWEYNGTGASRIIGEEGATRINSNSEFVWPQIESATTEVSATATTVTLPSDATATAVTLEERATAAVLEQTATAVAFEMVIGVAVAETATAITDAATPLPPTETATAEVTPTPTVVAEAALEALEGAISARIDLLGFDSINVRDLDG